MARYSFYAGKHCSLKVCKILTPIVEILFIVKLYDFFLNNG